MLLGNTLEEKIINFISYLDTIDKEQGDTPCLHMSWFRAGNNRRKTMIKNGSPFLSLQASVHIAKPKNTFGATKYFKSIGESPSKVIDDLYEDIVSYMKDTYGILHE